MFGFLRRLFGGSHASAGEVESPWNPESFVYVMIPGDIQPLARGERFEDPIAAMLQAEGLGGVSGAGSQLDDPYPDGRARVAFCGIDVDVVDLDRALDALRRKLPELDAPAGTELHYTAGGARLKDRFADGAWHRALPRSFPHPGFGV